MEVIRGIYNVKKRHSGCVVTVGNFDGVHHGHQMLLAHLIAKSEELSVPSVLITFEPQPREFFRGGAVPARLTRFREKITLLKNSGLDRVLCLAFNKAMSKVAAHTVIEDFLVRRLDVKYLVVGDDFRFGQGAEGDYSMLKEAGDKYGFGVSHLGTLTFEHGRVSSSRIREELSKGNLHTAESLLGHPYFIMGRVVYGRQLGRQLGAPTANLRVRRYQSALSGVFAVEVGGLDKIYQGVANIGMRPTVDGSEPLLEVHIFDWSGDLYGELLTVTFRHKIREEKKFDSLEALKEQIQRDMQSARAAFA
ncbi:MAG: bifunctional riboflavin kinase/FAD synthetase [Pseudomonadales bacterium]|nr:bifunctional riboflavin kinase/FAD synthetase [Pseudomonadales bacterium]